MSLKAVGPTRAERIAVYQDWQRIYLQVTGPGTLFYATTQNQLITPGPGGNDQGQQLVSGDGPRELTWRGPLWARGSVAQTLVDIQEPGL